MVVGVAIQFIFPLDTCNNVKVTREFDALHIYSVGLLIAYQTLAVGHIVYYNLTLCLILFSYNIYFMYTDLCFLALLGGSI